MIKVAKDLIIRSSSAEFLIFEKQTHDKGIQVRFEDGDLWLTQKAIGELFNTTRNNITMHINDIYSSYELEQNSTSKNFLLVEFSSISYVLYISFICIVILFLVVLKSSPIAF